MLRHIAADLRLQNHMDNHLRVTIDLLRKTNILLNHKLYNARALTLDEICLYELILFFNFKQYF